MKKLKQFFKDWWNALGEDLLPEPNEELYPFDTPEREDDEMYCPFCRYSGSAEDIRVHLLNRHKP